MRTAFIAAILFAGLLNCAYSAPQPQPDEDTEAVLQELQTVLEQGAAPTPAPTQFLCTKSSNAEAQFLGTALAAYKLGNAAYHGYKMWDDEQARDQCLNRKNMGKALKIANAAHRAWNDQQARDQWLTRKHVGTALKVANAAHKAWNNQQLADAQGAEQELADTQGANQELADTQGSPEVLSLSCTPVKVNSNGEVTFLDLE